MAKKIVVVDDDTSIQDIFKIILERAGYEVELLNSNSIIGTIRYNVPDLFILDKQLSGLDGLDICRHLKKQSKTAFIPVIMVSANPNISTLAIEAGADDYIEKPFEMAHLLKKIRQHTERVPLH